MHNHHSGHQHLHHRHGNKVKEVEKPQVSKRAVGDVVSATIDGQLVSWINVYAGPTDAPVLEAVDSTSASNTNADTAELPDMTSVASFTTTTGTPSSTLSTAMATSEDWARRAYFNAANGTVEGLTFLNHFGGRDGIPGTSAGMCISE